ncbi:MAG: hypothetical protein EB023_15420, partial [Flavobacteriia bacterium]|nr:hypothetical protein [Flavobacteriia bacterium]
TNRRCRFFYNSWQLDLYSSESIPENIWCNITWVIKNTTTIEYYLNGELKQTFTIDVAKYPGNFEWTNIKVGYDNRGGPFYFAGSISKILVSSDVLTAQQVSDNAKIGLSLLTQDDIIMYDRYLFTPTFMENFRNNTYTLLNGTNMYYDRTFEISPCLLLDQPMTVECYSDIWKYYGCETTPKIPDTSIGKTVSETIQDIREISTNTSDEQRMKCYGTNWPTRWYVYTRDNANHTPVRIVNNKIECMSQDGINCMWRATKESAELLIITPPVNIIPILGKNDVVYSNSNMSWEAEAYRFVKSQQ